MTFTNILLIDDDIEDQEIFQLALHEIPRPTVLNTFTNARNALDKLNATELNPDVIFLDLNMPIMTGQEFLLEIKKKKHLESIPIIVLSTTSHAPTISLTLTLGAFKFITKPETLDELVDILQPMIA